MPFDHTLLTPENSSGYWEHWAHTDLLTIDEAAVLLAGGDPSYGLHDGAHDHDVSRTANILNIALIRAVQCGNVQPFQAKAIAIGDFCTNQVLCDPSDAALCNKTTVRAQELARWADRRNLKHGWKPAPPESSAASPIDLVVYPVELRAAIEAFNAIRGVPNAMKGKTPKAALLAWLAANKPDLSGSARERIATVANWQPEGGAPKTPTADQAE